MKPLSQGSWPIFAGSLNRIGAVKGFTSKPIGFRVKADLEKIFADDFTGQYATPGFEEADLVKAFMRYDNVAICYDQSKLDTAVAWVYRIFAPYMRCPFATHLEVTSNFNLDASCGIPYNEAWPTKGDMLEGIGFDWLDAAFEQWLAYPYQCIWKHFLKEELRKVGKDTRGILCGAIDVEYFMQRFFLRQNKGFYSAYLSTPSAVGISRDGLEWNRLFLKLMKFPRGGASDISKYDSKMNEVLLQAACRLRKMFLGEDQAWAKPYIDLCYQILSGSVCFVNGELVQKDGGNPSGGVNTTPDNTLVHLLVLCYVFIELNHSCGFDDFVQFVSLALYGDDNAFTYDEEKVEFHPDKVAKVLHDVFGYQVKHTGLINTVDIDFLSAKFKFETVAGAQVAVPMFDHEKMVCHIVQSKTKDDSTEFQRVASLRALNCFDRSIVNYLDQWLIEHKHYVTHEQYNSWVPPIEVVRSSYYLPKRNREPRVFTDLSLPHVQGGAAHCVYCDMIFSLKRCSRLDCRRDVHCWCCFFPPGLGGIPTRLPLAQSKEACMVHHNIRSTPNRVCRVCGLTFTMFCPIQYDCMQFVHCGCCCYDQPEDLRRRLPTAQGLCSGPECRCMEPCDVCGWIVTHGHVSNDREWKFCTRQLHCGCCQSGLNLCGECFTPIYSGCVSNACRRRTHCSCCSHCPRCGWMWHNVCETAFCEKGSHCYCCLEAPPKRLRDLPTAQGLDRGSIKS